jgi:hypothetical protein
VVLVLLTQVAVAVAVVGFSEHTVVPEDKVVPV